MNASEVLREVTQYEFIFRCMISRFVTSFNKTSIHPDDRHTYIRCTQELIDLTNDAFDPKLNIASRIEGIIAFSRHVDGGGPTLEGVRNLDTYLQSLITRLKRNPAIILTSSGHEPNAPSPATQQIDFAWNLLHPTVVRLARSRFRDGYYADAVVTPAKELNNAVKAIHLKRSGKELDGAKLMHHAFSPTGTIELEDLSTETGRNIQSGYMEIFAGAIAAIRNPKSHENIVITPDRAMHHLFLISLLFFKLDEGLARLNNPGADEAAAV